MPLFNDETMEQGRTASHFGFSAKRVNDLGASEYTLVVIAVDVSTSVADFRDGIETAVREIVGACGSSPRADNLMLRIVTFANKVEELHGFRPLSECAVDKYSGAIRCGGCTSLYDAAVSAVESVAEYGKTLFQADYSTNAIVVVITDGEDNNSTMTSLNVRAALAKAVAAEMLESIVSILVGVNVSDPQLASYLAKLQIDVGFTQYVKLEDANRSTLAKLASFISRSISAQSQSLGTGGPSTALSF